MLKINGNIRDNNKDMKDSHIIKVLKEKDCFYLKLDKGNIFETLDKDEYFCVGHQNVE